MDDGASEPGCEARIVVLSQDSSLAWPTDGRGAGVVLAHAPSGYEAAAELLAAPTTALVIDLRLLAGRHLRLLEIARDLHVEVFAVGSLPIGMTAEDLSGVRLIARRDLPAAVQALVRPPSPAARTAAAAPPGGEQTERIEPPPPAPPAPAKTPQPDAPAAEPAPPAAVETDPALASMELPPAIEQALRGSGRRSRGRKARRLNRQRKNASRRRPEPPAGQQPEQGPAAAEGQAGGLLTPAELNALLGDDR